MRGCFAWRHRCCTFSTRGMLIHPRTSKPAALSQAHPWKLRLGRVTVRRARPAVPPAAVILALPHVRCLQLALLGGRSSPLQPWDSSRWLVGSGSLPSSTWLLVEQPSCTASWLRRAQCTSATLLVSHATAVMRLIRTAPLRCLSPASSPRALLLKVNPRPHPVRFVRLVMWAFQGVLRAAARFTATATHRL